MFFGETDRQNQANGKKIIKKILKKLDNFLLDYSNNSININNHQTQNFSQNIIDHLNIQIRNFRHKKEIIPKLDDTIEYFLNFSHYNVSFIRKEFIEKNFTGLKAFHLDINETLQFFLENFINLKKLIIIPPSSSHVFLKNIYPKVYLIYILFFDFCNKSINYGLFHSNFQFKKVFLYLYSQIIY